MQAPGSRSWTSPRVVGPAAARLSHASSQMGSCHQLVVGSAGIGAAILADGSSETWPTAVIPADGSSETWPTAVIPAAGSSETWPTAVILAAGNHQSWRRRKAPVRQECAMAAVWLAAVATMVGVEVEVVHPAEVDHLAEVEVVSAQPPGRTPRAAPCAAHSPTCGMCVHKDIIQFNKEALVYTRLFMM